MNTLSHYAKGLAIMGTIVCQDCHKIIEQYENEKVVTLYSTCPTCRKNK